MAYSFYPGKPSFLAQKYLREYIPRTTLQPGERYALRRTMEAKVIFLKAFLDKLFKKLLIFALQVPGYREIHQELRCASEEIEYQRFRSPERELAPPCWFRNSPVGYTTNRGIGNQWGYTHYPSNVRFSRATTPMLTSCNGMNKVYRYYGTHCYWWSSPLILIIRPAIDEQLNMITLPG